MANHKSSIKRIRQEEKRKLHNRYYAKTMRNAVKKLRATTDKAEAVALFPNVQKMLDKLAITGNPCAIASIITRPNPSQRELSTYILECA